MRQIKQGGRMFRTIKITQPKLLKSNVSFNFFRYTRAAPIHTLKFQLFKPTTHNFFTKKFYSTDKRGEDDEERSFTSMGGKKMEDTRETPDTDFNFHSLHGNASHVKSQRTEGVNPDGTKSELFVYYDWKGYYKEQDKIQKELSEKEAKKPVPSEPPSLPPRITRKMLEQVFNVYKYYERNYHTFRIGKFTIDRFLIYLTLLFLIIGYLSVYQVSELEKRIDYSETLTSREKIENDLQTSSPTPDTKNFSFDGDKYDTRFFNLLLMNVGMGFGFGYAWSYLRTQFRYASFKLHNEEYFKFFNRVPIANYVAARNARKASIIVGFVSSLWCITDYLQHLYQKKYSNEYDFPMLYQMINTFSSDMKSNAIYIAGDNVRQQFREILHREKQSTIIVRLTEYSACLATAMISRYSILPVFLTSYCGMELYNVLNHQTGEYKREFQYKYDVYDLSNYKEKALFVCKEFTPLDTLEKESLPNFNLHQPIDLHFNDEETQMMITD